MHRGYSDVPGLAVLVPLWGSVQLVIDRRWQRQSQRWRWWWGFSSHTIMLSILGALLFASASQLHGCGYCEEFPTAWVLPLCDVGYVILGYGGLPRRARVLR